MKRKVFYKIFVALYMLTMVVTIGASSAFAAGNHTDTYEEIYYNNDGCSRGTASRAKMDYTSSYLKITTGSDCGVFAVDVIGTKTRSPLTYFIPKANLCTWGTAKSLNIGEAKYLPNSVKEKGFGYCNLNFEIPYYGSCTIKILWSPDSV